MIYLRSILFYMGLALSTIPYAFIALLVLVLPAKLRSRVIAGWAVFATHWLHLTCNLRHQLIHPENIMYEPCVFASNHSSTWETITTQTFLPSLAWVLKRELLKIPFFGWGLWATRPIAIDRNNGASAMEQVISQGKDKLGEGRHVLIFPEGTRRPYGEKVGKYKLGAIKLARAANVPIVPIAHDAGKYWSTSSWWIKPGVIKCIIGPAIHIGERPDNEVMNEVKQWILDQQL